MDTIAKTEEIDHDRRRFFGAAAMTVAAAQLGMTGSADAEPAGKKLAGAPGKPGTNTSFGSLKQIDAGLLECRLRRSGSRRWPRRSFFCTAGPTTFTALSMSRRCWRRRATG